MRPTLFSNEAKPCELLLPTKWFRPLPCSFSPCALYLPSIPCWIPPLPHVSPSQPLWHLHPYCCPCLNPAHSGFQAFRRSAVSLAADHNVPLNNLKAHGGGGGGVILSHQLLLQTNTQSLINHGYYIPTFTTALMVQAFCSLLVLTYSYICVCVSVMLNIYKYVSYFVE